MKVILIDNLPNKGKKNQIINVADGYAINYLFKNKIAIPTTKSNLKTLQKRIAIAKEEDLILNQKMEQWKKTLEQKSLYFTLNTNEDKVFGSITHKQIIDKIFSDYDLKLSKQLFSEHHIINKIGITKVSLKLSHTITANLEIIVRKQKK